MFCSEGVTFVLLDICTAAFHCAAIVQRIDLGMEMSLKMHQSAALAPAECVQEECE